MKRTVLLILFCSLLSVLISCITVAILDYNNNSKWENKCIDEILKHEEMQDTFAWEVEELEFTDKFYNDIEKIYLITTYTEIDVPDTIKVCTWICSVEKGNYIDCDIFNVEYVEEVEE